MLSLFKTRSCLDLHLVVAVCTIPALIEEKPLTCSLFGVLGQWRSHSMHNWERCYIQHVTPGR